MKSLSEYRQFLKIGINSLLTLLVIGNFALSGTVAQSIVDKPLRQFGYKPGGIVSLSPDGNSLLTFSDKCYQIDATTGKIQVTYYPVTESFSLTAFSAACFSPDGKYVLTGNSRGSACLFNAATGDSIRSYPVDMPIDPVHTVLFLPDGTSLIAATQCHVSLFATETGELIRTFIETTSNHGVVSVAISPDGAALLTANEDNVMLLWDIATGDTIRAYHPPESNPVKVAVFSPDGNYIVTNSQQNTIRLWDRETADSVRSFDPKYSGVPTTIVFSRDGKYLAAGYSGALCVWNAATAELIHSFKPAWGAVSIAFSADGKRLFTGCRENKIRIADLDAKAYVDSIGVTSLENISSVAYSPDGKFLCTGARDNYAKIWNVDDGTCIGSPKGDIAGFQQVAFSADGAYLAGASYRKVAIWNTSTWDTVGSLSVYPPQFTCLAWSPDGKRIVTGVELGTTYALMWNTETGDSIWQFIGHKDDVVSAAYSPDGKYVLTGSSDKTARLWDAATGECIRIVDTFTTEVISVAFSPDGSLMAACPQTGTPSFCLWETASGACVRTFKGHNFGTNTVAFSHNGKFVLSGSSDKDARLWNSATGECLRIFRRHLNTVGEVAFSPDDKYVLTADGTRAFIESNGMYLWDISDISLSTRAAQLPANRDATSFSLHSKGGTTLHVTYTGRTAPPATLMLYQPSGRCVALLAMGNLTCGTSVLRLRHPLVPGVYYYRLRDDRSGKVVLQGSLIEHGRR